MKIDANLILHSIQQGCEKNLEMNKESIVNPFFAAFIADKYTEQYRSSIARDVDACEDKEELMHKIEQELCELFYLSEVFHTYLEEAQLQIEMESPPKKYSLIN